MVMPVTFCFLSLFHPISPVQSLILFGQTTALFPEGWEDVFGKPRVGGMVLRVRFLIRVVFFITSHFFGCFSVGIDSHYRADFPLHTLSHMCSIGTKWIPFTCIAPIPVLHVQSKLDLSGGLFGKGLCVEVFGR